MAKRNSSSHEFSPSVTQHVGPVAVWLLAVLCVIALFYQRSQRVEVVGLTRGSVHIVATASKGRLTRLAGTLFEPVTRGQVLAVVDALPDDAYARTLIEKQQETIKAEMKHLAAQLLPTQERLNVESVNQETSLAADARRFAVDVENAKLQILELRTRIETDGIALRSLESELATTRELVEQDAVDASELRRAELEHERLAATIKENEAQLELAQNNQALATERLERFSRAELQTPSVENALEVIRQEIDVYDKRLNELIVELNAVDSRKAIEIRAPFDGVISQIHTTVGAVVDVNQPILSLTRNNPSEVVAYVDEYFVDQIVVGRPVQVVKMGTELKVVNCRIDSIGPRVEQLPQQLWRSPSTPQWGRPFLIKIHSLDVAAGERVGVRLL